jgi:hypothetical protein
VRLPGEADLHDFFEFGFRLVAPCHSCCPPAEPGDPVASGIWDSSEKGRTMKKIIWMEMVLIGASILIFRSVWTFLDSSAWASGGVGLTVLLALGIAATVVALRSLEALSRKDGEGS